MDNAPQSSNPAPAEQALSTFQLIPLGKIKRSPSQARKDFDLEGLKGLAESIRLEGLHQPIGVRLDGQGYELVFGERRLRAVEMLGWPAIEAKILNTVSEGEAAAKGLIENLQRAELNPMEEAEGIQALLQLGDSHWTQAQVATVLGKRERRIGDLLQLLTLPAQIQDSLRRREMTLGHVEELMRINNTKEQLRLALKVGKKGLSVRETRALVDGRLKKAVGKNHSDPTLDPLENAWAAFRQTPPLEAKAVRWEISHPAPQEWILKLKTAAQPPAQTLAPWFVALGTLLSQGDTPSLLSPLPSDPPPSLDANAMTPSRLPQTPEEEAELEKLAGQGPGPVYVWLYGPDHAASQMMAQVSWTDLGAPSAIQGCRDLLAQLKNMKESGGK